MVEDQRRLAATIRPQNRHMLPRTNLQVHIVQHDTIAARHIHLRQFKKLLVVAPRLLVPAPRLFILPSAPFCAIHWIDPFHLLD